MVEPITKIDELALFHREPTDFNDVLVKIRIAGDFLDDAIKHTYPTHYSLYDFIKMRRVVLEAQKALDKAKEVAARYKWREETVLERREREQGSRGADG